MSPQQRATINALRAAGSRGVTTGQFLEMRVSRFPERIRELKALGYDIRRERVTNSKHIYRLLAEPAASSERGVQSRMTERQRHPMVPAAPRSEDAEGTLFDMPDEPTTISAITGKRAA